jgi:S-adenosylmethionine:tRNA ribosyltransferase-isomerase
LRLSDFDFELPEGAIARRPADRRDRSRLLRLDRHSGAREHRHFFELPELLQPGDLLVVNDSKVLKARLYTHKEGSGGKVEVLLIEPVSPTDDRRWRAMVAASKPVRVGARLVLPGAEPLVVEAVEGEGFVVVHLPEPALGLTERLGALPLPPYMERPAEAADAERYQTVYAAAGKEGSVAAPTAGLHFTPELLVALTERGIERANITLHVGPGTFLPVRTDDVAHHQMHAERFVIPEETAQAISRAKSEGRRVVAVGTTVVRTLESQSLVLPGLGSTALFIKPGFEFRTVDALITNFHLPRSTLLMLVSAFAGTERVLAAYREAVASGYRFYSYGDAMLIA